MIYQTLYRQFKKQEKVRAGIIGAGQYGTAVITQSMYNEYLDIPIIADSNLKAAKSAYQMCGIKDDDIIVCDSHRQAAQAIEQGKYVVTEDPMVLMDLPLDIIAESTGIPEAGALYGFEVIKHGKHLAMINKETDSVVGPYLKYLANRAGLLYTPVDGDQHGLLMGMVSWAKSLGLDIVSAGKFRDAEFIYDREKSTVTCLRDDKIEGEVTVSEEDLHYLNKLPDGEIGRYMKKRNEILKDLPLTRNFDVCEIVIAANALGLSPDVPELHLPVVRTTEIPRVLCPKADGGILEGAGRIDAVTCYREEHEARLGGGVYIIATSRNEYSRYILNSKGLLHNTAGNASMIYMPYHLCGVETSTSFLTTCLLGLPTGYEDYLPRFDMVRRTTRDLKKGQTVDDDYSFDYVSSIIPAIKSAPESPIPAHMAFTNKLAKDVPAGSILTYDMIERPKDSVLWKLREEQEEHFSAR